MSTPRPSDRWVTPGVIIVAIIVTGVVILSVAGGVVYLTAVGRDAGPVIQLVAQVATGIGAMGSLVLQLAGRKTAAKTERNTGAVAAAVLPPGRRPWEARRTDTAELPEALRGLFPANSTAVAIAPRARAGAVPCEQRTAAAVRRRGVGPAQDLNTSPASAAAVLRRYGTPPTGPAVPCGGRCGSVPTDRPRSPRTLRMHTERCHPSRWRSRLTTQ